MCVYVQGEHAAEAGWAGPYEHSPAGRQEVRHQQGIRRLQGGRGGHIQVRSGTL